MGITHATTQIQSINRSGKAYSAEFFVDMGAIDCVAPASSLKAAGVKPEGKAVYEMADDRTVEMQYRFVRVTIVDAETVAQVIFGPEGCEPLLGVVALENTGISIDPRSRASRRLHAKPLKYRSRLHLK